MRQRHSFAHHVVFLDEETILVNDLGGDAIVALHLDPSTGSLEHLSSSAMPPGTGPRHLAFVAPDLVAISGELASTVVLARLDRTAASLVVLDVTSSTWDRGLPTHSQANGLPVSAEANLPSDIKTFGNLIFVANRGRDTVGILRAVGDRLDQVVEAPAGGRTPQHLLVTDQSLLVACLGSDVVTIWDRSGATLDQRRHVVIPRPAWLTALPD